MKLKKLISFTTSVLMIITLLPTNVLAESNDESKVSTKYTHGSEVTVTEDQLLTEKDIPEDYDVNSATQGKAKDGTYTKLFNNESIEDVYIDIDSNNWNYLLQNAINKPTVLTNSVTIGGETVKYAGIKTKGNLTLSSTWQSNSDRFSFTVNFGKYIKKKSGYSANQNFYGLSKVSFNNIYGDATLMKEYLSYELMNKMGVETPCYSLVNLYVNNELWGVYMMVESVDSALTNRTLGEESDFLVKPESSGGDLIYDSSLDKYWNEETSTFDFSDLTASYPSDASNPLYKYNGLWENDEDTFNDVKDSLPTVFKWMKTLNELSNSKDTNTEEYKAKLESIMDVDEIIRYFATNTYLVNLDSYQSEKMQNYALYINDNGLARVLPWDYNYSFGAYGTGDAQTMINFDISNPVIDVELNQRPLLNVILQNDDYKALYEKYLNDCTIIASKGGTTSDSVTYSENNFSNIINNYYKTLSTTYSNDPTAFYTISQYKEATEAFKELISLRSKAVQQQLSGNTELVTTNINLKTLGDAIGGGGGQQPGDGNQPGGQNPPNMTETILTDKETNVSVTGMFPPEAKLSVSKITSGDSYTSTTKLLSEITNTFNLYNISVDMGDMNGNSSNPGNPPSNGDDTTNPPNNGDTTNPPDMPSGDNTQQEQQSMKISLPIDSKYTDGNYEFKAYKINNDGTKTEVNGSVDNGKYVISSTENGLFALAIINKNVTKDISNVTVDSISDKAYTGSVIKPSIKVKDGSTTLKLGTDYKVTYSNNTKIGTAKITIEGIGNYAGSKTVTFKIVPKKVTSLKLSKRETNSLTLSWNKVSNATGYKIYKYDSSTKKYKLLKTISNNSTITYTDKSLSSATNYSYKIRAYKVVDGKTYYGSYSFVLKGTTKPLQPVLTVKSSVSKKATLTWSKKVSKKTDGYEVYMSTSKTGTYKLIKTTKSTKLTKTGLKSKKTYYFKVRAYRIVDGKKVYSSYSTIKSIKVK